MPNLEELFINDTKLGLSHLLQILKICKKVSKLSFSLVERSLDEFKEQPQRVTRSRSRLQAIETSNLSIMKQGFQKLTHLKIFTFVLGDAFYVDFWPVTLGVLG